VGSQLHRAGSAGSQAPASAAIILSPLSMHRWGSGSGEELYTRFFLCLQGARH